MIIAAYRAAAFVGAAIESALDQSLAPLEVVVCDDGSDDGTDRVVSEFGDAVRLLRQEHGGEAAAKNAASRAARGEFVVVLDADDRWLPERLAAMGELTCARPDLDIITTDAWMEVGGRRVRRAYNEGWPFAATDQRYAILDRNFVFGHAAVRRRALLAIGGFDETIRRTTDWDCWLRMIYAGSRVGLVDEPLAIYRVHASALSAHRSAMRWGAAQTLRKARGVHLDPGERRFLEGSIARYSRDARWAELREHLVNGPGAVRPLAWTIARDSGFSWRLRLRALACALVPRLGRWLLMRRQARDASVGAGHVAMVDDQ